MNIKKIQPILFCLSILMLLPGQVDAQRLPAGKKVIKAMNLANDYLVKKWPDPGAPIVHPDKTRPASIWTRAVYYEGLMALYQVNPREEYLNYAVQWGEKHNWNMAYNHTYTRHADNQACGQAYIDLYLLNREPKRIEATKACIDSMMRTPKIDDWTWIDAIQMAMPVFARLGHIYNDTAYYNRMLKMYACTRNKLGGNGLFNEPEGLWWRDADFVPPYREPNGEDCYWSRGNGWVMAALVRTMDFVPENSPYYTVFLSDFQKMAAALVPIQRPDGYWNVSLHDSTHFGGKELTGTALFTYGMAWGIRKGYLKRETYLPVVIKAWNAMVKYSLHDNGFLGFVQGTGKEPKDGQPVTYDRQPNFEDYGLGCFLLAGSEVYKLKP